MIEFRRTRPLISYPRSYILPADEYSPYSSDEEIVSTLPAIVNTHPIRPRLHEIVTKPSSSPYFPSAPYRTVIENEPLVYQRVHTPIFTDERSLPSYRSYETPIRHLSPPPPQRNVHLPKHTKKLVNRFLSNLEHAHSHQVSTITIVCLPILF